jgi:hypothetical protein
VRFRFLKGKEYLGGEKLLSIPFPKPKQGVFEKYNLEFGNYFINCTFGAHCSLLAIIDDLKFNANEYALLPSYICDSVLKSFDLRGIPYKFYAVQEDLTPDFSHIDSVIRDNIRVLFFIDYLGRPQTKNVSAHLKKYADKNIAVIQDAVHCIKLEINDLYGDYIINSFRKTTPFEGSIILSKGGLRINFSRGMNFKFLFYKRFGQILRSLHLKLSIISPGYFLKCLQAAEKHYYSPFIHRLPVLNRWLINRIDFNEMAANNRLLYRKLFKLYGKYVPGHLQNSDFTPLGFFIVIPNRNEIVNKLRANSIFCPIFWRIPNEVTKEDFRESWFLSNNSLVIPFSYPMTMSLNSLLSAVKAIIFYSANL